MTLAASRAKCQAGGGPLERRVRAHFFPLLCAWRFECPPLQMRHWFDSTHCSLIFGQRPRRCEETHGLAFSHFDENHPR
jgi:hypothetical protein